MVKFPKPRTKDITEMSDADYLIHIAEKIMKGQRPRPKKNDDGSYSILWSAEARKGRSFI